VKSGEKCGAADVDTVSCPSAQVEEGLVPSVDEAHDLSVAQSTPKCHSALTSIGT
jgi:hypothetical protein